MGKLYLGTQEITPFIYDEKEFIGIPKEIVHNGVHDVESYSSAQTPFEFKMPDEATMIANGALLHAFYVSHITKFTLNNVQRLGVKAMKGAFNSCNYLKTADMSKLIEIQSGSDSCLQETFGSVSDGTSAIETVDFSSLTTINGYYAMMRVFYNCQYLTSVDFSSLTTISGENGLAQAFSSCTALTSMSFPSLTTVSGVSGINRLFMSCRNLASVNMNALTTISGSNGAEQLFSGCTSLTSMSFPSLTTLTGSGALYQAFYNCTGLTSVSFPVLSDLGTRTNQFNDMLKGCSNVTVHFPEDLQSTLSSWTSVQNGFGGTNTTILYDL